MSSVHRPLFLAVTQALLLGGVVTAQANRLGDPIQVGPDFVVNATDDSGDGFCEEVIGTCTLRDAVEAANADPDASVITFDPTVFASQTTITLSQSDMVIDQSTTIAGPGADRLTIDAADQSRHFNFIDLSAPNQLLDTVNTVSGLTLVNGNGSTDITDIPNLGRRGGAIRTQAPLTLDQVHLRDNSAPDGGALWARFAEVTIQNSTLSGNTGSNRGGAVYSRENNLTISNTTISGNAVRSDSVRGAAIGLNRTTLTVLDSTISDNDSALGGGAAIQITAGDETVRIERAVIGNTIGGPDLGGPDSFELERSLVENAGAVDVSNNVASIVGLDPLLGALQDNGGPLPTHTLLLGSPAIDTAGVDCPDADQRGEPRPVDGDGDLIADCDMGAVELQSIPADTIFNDSFESPNPDEV